jgi:outer membrane protein assembly factor BamB
MRIYSFAAALGLVQVWALPLRADDWPSFRGPAGDGLSAEAKAPVAWGPGRNVLWKLPLPHAGNGSPVVAAGRVFVCGPEDAQGLRRSLWCVDRKDGRLLWKRTVEFGRALKTHETNPHSSSTPATDGKRVVVWHGSAGLYCYDLEGKELWAKTPGTVEHMWGDGVSPVIHRGRVILNCGPGKRNFLAALDLETGGTLWETEEPSKGSIDANENGKYKGSWCTPLVAAIDGREQILCAQPTRICAYEPASGQLLWWCEGVRHEKGDLAYSSPVIAGDVLVYAGGFNGPMLGVRLGGNRGDCTSTHRLWRLENRPQSIGSGVAVDGKVYIPQAGPARIDCIDPKTGKALWEARVDGKPFWGSIVHAGGLLYVANQRGGTVVFRPSAEKFDLVGVNDLKEGCNTTPAVSDGDLFLRTDAHLYCIRE